MKRFSLGNSEHHVGDRRCLECYKDYPTKCLCGGLIHAQFIKETWDNQLELNYLCDVCGQNFNFPKYSNNKKSKYRKKRHN